LCFELYSRRELTYPKKSLILPPYVLLSPKKENDTRLVQVFSGHKRASTTIGYKQTELEQLQNAIENYHPIS
jgi:hypothetical protein